MAHKPLFVLINGRGGVGKTTTLHALLEHPPRGWVFFDFDNGKFPPPKEGESGKDWRRAQHNWWIQVVKKIHDTNALHVCIFGVGIFPWQMEELAHATILSEEQYIYGVLTCTDETRKERLKSRGSTHIAEYDVKKFEEILNKMKAHGAKEFSTENVTPEEVARDIRKWLESL